MRIPQAEYKALYQQVNDLIARRDELLAELEQVKARYMRGTQAWVDGTCHYRNLAIQLGAKPVDMLNSFDRDLCEKHDASSTDGWENELPDVWADLERAERERDALEEALRAVVESQDRDEEGYPSGKSIAAARAALAGGTPPDEDVTGIGIIENWAEAEIREPYEGLENDDAYEGCDETPP